jgi:glucose-1-phosphate thymidylyltransferase
MQVIIPMAGYGTRMRPHTYSRPKPLINVAGQPMLKHLLDPLLAQLEIDEFIFIVGYLGEQVKEWVAETYDIKATYVVQDELIGQAHAIHLSRQHLHGPALLLFSDTLFDADLSVIKDFTGDGLAFVKEVDDPRRFGVVALNDEGRIVQFVEKPDSMENKLAVIGMYYLRDSAQMLHAVDTLMARKQMTRGEFYLASSSGWTAARRRPSWRATNTCLKTASTTAPASTCRRWQSSRRSTCTPMPRSRTRSSGHTRPSRRAAG